MPELSSSERDLPWPARILASACYWWRFSCCSICRWPVIEEEESYLRQRFLEYADYERRVPRLWPRLARYGSNSSRFQPALYLRNQEYQALAGFLVVMTLLVIKRLYWQ
jgi:hypothetical protein